MRYYVITEHKIMQEAKDKNVIHEKSRIPIHKQGDICLFPLY